MDSRRTSYSGRLTKAMDPLQFKAVSADEGVVTSYDTLYWVVDSYGEFTVPGCADKTIADRGPKSATPRILGRYEHAWTIGRYLSMESDATGVWSELQVSDDGQWGTAVRRQLADGVPYGKSIGFRAIRRRPATEADAGNLKLESAPDWVRTVLQEGRYEWLTALEELMLYESSIVSFPAVEPIVVDDYRSDRDAPVLERVLTDLKAGRLSADEVDLLRQITAALPVDAAPGPGETPGTPPSDRAAGPTVRNRSAELALVMTRAGIAIQETSS